MDFTSIISSLVNFIQVKFQGKLISPFETHPLATGVAICSLLLHFLLLRLADGASQLLINFTGSISVAWLAWVLLHDSNELELLLQLDIQVSGAKRATILDVDCGSESNCLAWEHKLKRQTERKFFLS